MTTPRFIPLLLIVLALGFSSCEREEIQISAPEGEFTFGTKRNDIICDAILLQDGNYMLVGGAQQEDDFFYDPWLLKLDPDGNEIWQKNLPFSDRNVFARYIIPTGNEFLVLAIENDNNYGAQQFYFIWLDQDFELVRQTSLPVDAYAYELVEYLSGIYEMDNLGYALPMQISSSLSIFRTDFNGNPAQTIYVENFVPNQSYAGDRRDYFKAAPGGGYVYVREYYQDNDFFFQVNYLNKDLQITSSQNYPTTGYGFALNATAFLPDSSLVVTFSEPFSPLANLYHIDPAGNVIAEYTDPSSPIRFIKPMDNGNVALFAGFSSRNNRPYQLAGEGDFRVIEMTSDWDTVREIEFGGDQHERLMQVVQGSDGRFMMCGFTESYGAGGLDAYVTFFNP